MKSYIEDLGTCASGSTTLEFPDAG